MPKDPHFQAILAHVNRHVGPVAHVFALPGPKIVRVDLLHVPPTPRRRCHTIVTCGMSRRPMPAPAEAPDCRWGEFYLSLPAGWRLVSGGLAEEVMWPLRALVDLALLPHVHESWIWYGHTVGSPDPRERITPGLPFTAWIVGPHLSLGHEACRIRLPAREVLVMAALPIHADELDLVLAEGAEALFERMSAAGISDVLDVRRGSVAGEGARDFRGGRGRWREGPSGSAG